MKFLIKIKSILKNIFYKNQDAKIVEWKSCKINKFWDLEIFLPERFRNSFDIKYLEEENTKRILECIEKEENIPIELKNKKVVLNWFCNSVEVSDFPFKWKPMYIRFTRRRWKEKWFKNSYSNNYKFHKDWMKATDEFGFFLKEVNWC